MSKDEIKAGYQIDTNAHFISISNESYAYRKLPMLNPLADGGTVVLNTHYSTDEEVNKYIPNDFLRELAEKNAQF